MSVDFLEEIFSGILLFWNNSSYKLKSSSRWASSYWSRRDHVPRCSPNTLHAKAVVW